MHHVALCVLACAGLSQCIFHRSDVAYTSAASANACSAPAFCYCTTYSCLPWHVPPSHRQIMCCFTTLLVMDYNHPADSPTQAAFLSAQAGAVDLLGAVMSAFLKEPVAVGEWLK